MSESTKSTNIDSSQTSIKPRCFICNKKLNLIEQTSGACRCGQVFCSKHRAVQNTLSDTKSHPCSIETIKQLHKKNLELVNPKIVVPKMTYI